MQENQVSRRHVPYTKFKAFLEEKGIKQSQLASLLNKSTPAVNQNLNGTGGDFSITEVRQMCKVFNISADDFFIYPEVSNMKPN